MTSTEIPDAQKRNDEAGSVVWLAARSREVCTDRVRNAEPSMIAAIPRREPDLRVRVKWPS